jgi:hypothetical protein
MMPARIAEEEHMAVEQTSTSPTESTPTPIPFRIRKLGHVVLRLHHKLAGRKALYKREPPG